MAIIQPFRALRYNLKTLKELNNVVCPPYDIINKELKINLIKSSKYNYIHIELPDSYSDAKKSLTQWLNKKILIQDKNDSIYIFQQKFGSKIRTGFFCLLKLDEKYIIKHEHTSQKPIEDRLNLLKTLKIDTSPIFVIALDEKNLIHKKLKNIISKTKYDIKFEFENIKNFLWCISDKKVIDELKRILEKQHLLIADGHHRFQTSIIYKNEIDNKKEYIMTYICSANDPGLCILPTHRVVKFSPEIQNNINKYFNLTTWDKEKTSKIVYYKSGEFYTLKLKNKYKEYINLPCVCLLHELILKEINVGDIFYTKDIQEAIKLTNTSQLNYSGIAFLLEAPSIKSIFYRSKAGKIFPHKSTYFYPKVPSGVVIHSFND